MMNQNSILNHSSERYKLHSLVLHNVKMCHVDAYLKMSLNKLQQKKILQYISTQYTNRWFVDVVMCRAKRHVINGFSQLSKKMFVRLYLNCSDGSLLPIYIYGMWPAINLSILKPQTTFFRYFCIYIAKVNWHNRKQKSYYYYTHKKKKIHIYAWTCV